MVDDVLKFKEGTVIRNDEGLFRKSFFRISPSATQATQALITSVTKVSSSVPAVIVELLVPTGEIVRVMDEYVRVDSFDPI